MLKKPYYIDLKNKVFGRLKVLCYYKKNKHKNTLWKCKCSCGNITISKTTSLTSGIKQSCGCLSREMLSKYRGANKLPEGESSLNYIISNYKARAKRKNISFKLDKEDFRKLVKGRCFYCGQIPRSILKTKLQLNGIFIYNGIDRLNNKKGYTRKNSVSCCANCNYFKRAMSKDEFLNKIKKIYKYRIKGK